MFIKKKFLIFIPSLMMGTILSVSSSSWMSAWMGLEINLMSLIPILMNKMSYSSVESSIKYFLVQAMSSSTLIFFSVISLSFNFMSLEYIIEAIIVFTLLLKAGVAPLHFWFPQVISCAQWSQSIIILTWQKIAPFIMISFSISSVNWIFIMTSALVGMVGGINQTNMKLIMAYSSIIHSSWMLALISTNELMWWAYLMGYFFITYSVIYIFNKFNLVEMNSLFKMNIGMTSKMTFLMNFFSLAGMPPFLGFFMKLLAINSMVEANMNLMLISLLILSSINSFYFYLRVIYSSLLISEMNYSMKNMNSSMILLSKNFFMTSLSLNGMLVIPAIILLT